MGPKQQKLSTSLLPISAATIVLASALSVANGEPTPLIIQEQGSFAVGGTVIHQPWHLRSLQTDSRRADVSR